MLFVFCLAAHAQTEADPYPDYLEETFMDMDFEGNLASPAVPDNLKKSVSDYVKKNAEEFQRSLPGQVSGSVKVELTRKGEVILVISLRGAFQS